MKKPPRPLTATNEVGRLANQVDLHCHAGQVRILRKAVRGAAGAGAA